MSKKDEALKLPDRRIATSAGNPEDYINSGWNECLDAIREALAEQPAQQQEPVAYMNPDDLEKMKRFGRGSVAWATPTDFCTQPVYTSPPASKPLTDDTKRLDALLENSWDLRCFDMPTGAGDADVGWRVIEHHMAKPQERTVAEVYCDDPRQAIDAAIEAAHGIKGNA